MIAHERLRVSQTLEPCRPLIRHIGCLAGIFDAREVGTARLARLRLHYISGSRPADAI